MTPCLRNRSNAFMPASCSSGNAKLKRIVVEQILDM
jgi:hypothetical protein